VIYGGYYDESGDGCSFAVAGYAASYLTWVHLDWEWRDLLELWKIKYFKASECESGLGEFAQYRDDPRNLKADLEPHERERLREAKTRFVDAICKHFDDLRGVGAVVSVKDFDRIISEDAVARSLFMDHPYFVCLQAALVAATTPMRKANETRPKDDQVYLKPIFDSHEEYSTIAKVAYNKFLMKNPLSARILLPLNYDDDISTSALQVADMLAYEARKEMTKRIRHPERDTRVPMARLIPGIEKIFKLDFASLRTIIDNQSPDSIQGYVPIGE